MTLRVRDKQSARRATVSAQAAAVVLAVSGVALGKWGPDLLELDEPSAPEVAPDPAERQAQGEAPGVVEVDTAVIDENFNYIANRPQPDPEPVAGADDQPPPTEPAEETGVRYVGSVRSGERFAAWVNIDGTTKLLRPGGVGFAGVELVSVDEDEIVISIDGGDEQAVQRSERQGPAVTMVVGGAPAPEPVIAGEAAEEARFTPDMSREERRAMLLERAREERERSWRRDREQTGEEGGPGRIER